MFFHFLVCVSLTSSSYFSRWFWRFYPLCSSLNALDIFCSIYLYCLDLRFLHFSIVFSVTFCVGFPKCCVFLSDLLGIISSRPLLLLLLINYLCVISFVKGLPWRVLLWCSSNFRSFLASIYVFVCFLFIIFPTNPCCCPW